MAFRPWARRMQVEVDQLPETLSALREASVHIRVVAEDLAVVAASLKRVTEALDAAGLVETTEMIQSSANAMRATTKQFEELNQAVFGGLSKLPGAGDLFRGLRDR